MIDTLRQAPGTPPARAGGGWRLATYAWALLAALGLTYFIWRAPFQVSDFIGNLLVVRHESFLDLFRQYGTRGPYFRPFVWAFFKVVFDLAHGHYAFAYKLTQVIQVSMLFLLFARLLGVRTWNHFAAVPFGFAVLIGMHTFGGFLFELYPVNVQLTVAVLTLAAFDVAESRGGWWADVLASGILAVAMLCFELGLLVWVVIVAARLAGARGVSRKGVAACSVVFVAYFAIRYFLMGVHAPGVAERSSGYLFRVLEPGELQALFGAHLGRFYAYNILCSFSSVLFAEPRAGVWRFVAEVVRHDEIPEWMLINLVTSTLTTLAIIVFSLRCVRRWLRLRVTPEERPVVVFWAVALANAVISFPYTKDQIIGPAGCFYALAAYFVARSMVLAQPRLGLAARGFVVAVLLVLSCGWTVRSMGLVYNLHDAAYRHRNEWLTVDDWLRGQGLNLEQADRDFVRGFQREMLAMPVPPPYFVYGRWGSRFADQN